MVPGSTFRYGSNFMRLTFKPRLSSRQPTEAAASPLPKEDTTPPVTKMYFADILSSPQFARWFVCTGGVHDQLCLKTPAEASPSCGRVPSTLYRVPSSGYPTLGRFWQGWGILNPASKQVT